MPWSNIVIEHYSCVDSDEARDDHKASSQGAFCRGLGSGPPWRSRLFRSDPELKSPFFLWFWWEDRDWATAKLPVNQPGGIYVFFLKKICCVLCFIFVFFGGIILYLGQPWFFSGWWMVFRLILYHLPSSAGQRKVAYSAAKCRWQASNFF